MARSKKRTASAADLFTDHAPPDAEQVRATKESEEDARQRAHRAMRARYFERLGVRVNLDDPVDVQRADEEAHAVIARRSDEVAQGWTWIRGDRERIEAVPQAFGGLLAAATTAVPVNDLDAASTTSVPEPEPTPAYDPFYDADAPF